MPTWSRWSAPPGSRRRSYWRRPLCPRPSPTSGGGSPSCPTPAVPAPSPSTPSPSRTWSPGAASPAAAPRPSRCSSSAG
ncbi:hypothetical protein D7X32_09150 [Corallococcus carmarthensis]|uniref:Uncharacterized protein n=1 Tax=Corallococcus carmarthensis TaxID=2316728 RepID=A0A3A8KRP4_9BACT|nr:hypothetical protein D7X32_09150 [Corallococcus carmarthensis]